MDNIQVRVKELHTLREPYKGKKYFIKLPQYPSDSDGDLDDEQKATLIEDWTNSLAEQINNRPHNPRSDILYNTRKRSQVAKVYKQEGDEGSEWKSRYLQEKDPTKWATFEDLISEEPIDENYWFNSGIIDRQGARLGRIMDWGYTSKEFLRGMIRNKVNGASVKSSKHFVGKQGEKSRIFDLINGYYYITTEDAEAIGKLLPFILNFLKKLNTEDDFVELRQINPNTNEKINPNQEEIQYQFINPNDIYHTHLRFQVLQEVAVEILQDIDLDLDLIIKYWMAQEKLLRGEVKAPATVTGKVMGFFRANGSYAKALEDMGMDNKQLSDIIKNSQNLLDEINQFDDEELQSFVDDKKPELEPMRNFQTTEEYVFEKIKISTLLNKIRDKEAKKALTMFRPPTSAGKDVGGLSIEEKMKDLAIEKEHFLIWITNNPLDVIMQNTSQAWGQKTSSMWYGGDGSKTGKSCINFNGQYACGPYFDFYNGNGVAYVAKIDEDIINDYISVMKKEDNEKFPNLSKMTPEELFNSNECEIVGRMSLRWGKKKNAQGTNIGWGTGLETTIYPKDQKWAFKAFQGVARILKEMKDNLGNSIWDSSRNESNEPMQTIKAPYKMGWAYLDYNSEGYYESIPVGDYDCNGLGSSKKLVPNYDIGLKFDASSSTRARAVQLQEGVELNYEDYVRFDFRGFQQITQGLLKDIRLYGSIDPSIYRTVAQNPQIWVSEPSLAIVINGLFANTRQEQYQPIRKDFLEFALDTSSQNISWLLQYPVNETSIAGTLDMYDTTKTWNYGENCLLKTIYNHPSVMKTFKGHTPDISIQEHLYKQEIKLVDSATGQDFAMASDLFLLDLNIDTGKAPARMIDNAILTDMIQELKSSAKTLKMDISSSSKVFPHINVDWDFWSNRTQTANVLKDHTGLVLAYYQLKTIHNLSYSPLLSSNNYKTLCEVMGLLYKFLNSETMSSRKYKKLMEQYYKAYKALSMNLLYDKSNISSICYSNNELFTHTIQPQLLNSSQVMDWAFNSLYGVGTPPAFEKLVSEDYESRNRNPLTKLVINFDDVLNIVDLQNTICINSWDSIPMGDADKGYKLYIYYYLYHFIRSPRIFNKVFNSYMEFINKYGSLNVGSPNGSFPLTAILLDNLVDQDGNLLSTNPFINNKQIEQLYPYLNPNLYAESKDGSFTPQVGDFSQLRTTVFGKGLDVSEFERDSVGTDGLNAFIGLILDGDNAPQEYGMDNLFKLLRTPNQFRMAEMAMLKLSLGPYFNDRRGEYIFKVPTELKRLSEAELLELLYSDMDAYSAREELQSDIELRLNRLKNYLVVFAQNPYIPQSMQSRLILSTQNTNAFSKSVKVIETTNGRRINQSEANIHYSDIFDLYGSNIYNEVRYREIVSQLVKNPIIGVPTINQIVTYIDESLISQLILNAKFDLDAKELFKQKDIINQYLFDMAPEIIEKNPAISDEIRLKLFEIYLNNIFKTPMPNMTDSLKILRDFAYDSGDAYNFRDATNYGNFQSVLQKLNFDNIGMWRGGFGRFNLNKFIPPNVVREGESICEQPIIKQKPQLIIDINFKPPYENVFLSQDEQFFTEELQQELEDIDNAIEQLNDEIQSEVEELGWESYQDLQDNMAEDMRGLEEYNNLRGLIQAKERKAMAKRELKEKKAELRQSAPIKTTIRYIDNKEESQKGIKLSGRYWDSSRKRMSNKWSEFYSDWNAVYGAGNYGERADGSPKNWKNQVTLVFFDNNPNISWNPVSTTGNQLPKWRMNDTYCRSDAFTRIMGNMISNMKNPEENLIPLLLTLIDFIEKSGNFKWNSSRGEIVSRNNIMLLDGDSYKAGIGNSRRLNLGLIFRDIDLENLWPLVEYAYSNDSFYTENKIALLMFLTNLMAGGGYSGYKIPNPKFLDLLYQIGDAESYYEALAKSELLTYNFPNLNPDSLQTYFNYDLGKIGVIEITSRGILYSAFDYENFIHTTGYNILRGMGMKIEGVEDDISIFAKIYEASLSRPNSNIHNHTRTVLLERQEDWVTYMRNRGDENPEAVIQEAEEYESSKKGSLNIDDKKMERYIRLILGGKEVAQSNVS